MASWKKGQRQFIKDPTMETVKAGNRILRSLTGPEIQMEARRYGKAALKCLKDVVRSKTASDAAKINASQIILDRAFGKATQTNITTTVEVDGKPSEVTEAELNRRIKAALERIEAAPRRKREKIKSEIGPVDLRKYH